MIESNLVDGGVAVHVTARPRPGSEIEYERVLNGMLTEAASFAGCLGTALTRDGDVFEVVLRFDTAQDYRDWEASPERHRWARQLVGLLAEASETRRLSGLDAWTVDPALSFVAPPAKWKTAIVTWLGIFPTVVVLVVLVGVVIPVDRFLLLGNLAVTILCTIAMTYAVMPMLTRVLHRWLQPGP